MNHKKRIQQIYKSRKRKIYKKKKKIKIINHKKLIQTDIAYFIHCLPEDIQKRIYIITWKMIWRDYVPLTAQAPSWHHHMNYIKNKLWDAQLNNIHFLHLPFNTLPENKKWIMGCQCDFCLNDTEVDVVEKYIHYLIQYRNSYYFTDNFMPNESISSWNEYLVPVYKNPFIDDNTILKKVFDPLCGSYKENYTSKRLREGGKFEFSYPF